MQINFIYNDRYLVLTINSIRSFFGGRLYIITQPWIKEGPKDTRGTFDLIN